jgi:acyl-CoA synthetase (AMP-forming)/AMP-acid ligase II
VVRLDDRARRVAGGLVGAGGGSQDRVVFLDKNGFEHFEVVYGAALANVVCVDVNWRLAPAEVAYVVNDCAAKVIAVGPDFVPVVEAIEAAGVVQHNYTAPGEGHRILERDNFYELEVNGVRWIDSVKALIAGEPLDDVHWLDTFEFWFHIVTQQTSRSERLGPLATPSSSSRSLAEDRAQLVAARRNNHAGAASRPAATAPPMFPNLAAEPARTRRTSTDCRPARISGNGVL